MNPQPIHGTLDELGLTSSNSKPNEIGFGSGLFRKDEELCQPRLTTRTSLVEQYPSNQMGSRKRKRTGEETAIPTSVSSTVSKPSKDAESKLKMSDDTEKDECHKLPMVYIWFKGLTCCRTINKYISLDHNIDETDLMKRARERLHLSSEGAEAKIDFLSKEIQRVEWTVSSKQGSESRWPAYLESLLERRNGKGIHDGVYAVVTCLDLHPFVCEDGDGLEGPCSRK